MVQETRILKLCLQSLLYKSSRSLSRYIIMSKLGYLKQNSIHPEDHRGFQKFASTFVSVSFHGYVWYLRLGMPHYLCIQTLIHGVGISNQSSLPDVANYLPM